ncbi:alpha-D-ribose 1-methylphosphonate 5-triphosphate synthase subunit PhnH [Halogranum rubrum]|uniref:Alpha-D-ribose 1-methylphosphonate 5-triphosphate synthase subunit PhnH n=1 Tax=Halogranum rubrum TaxID=553466 RepID=A0A1I4BG86_9EURY|nr:phosphonate C-P lyase system protein PhnH [Halogranum rubrum]SFK67882.1 alpha-D-ribose 1-methylphosphonate 5-triphosphate synthase subunit PhnH [Halogranum rubrum]
MRALDIDPVHDTRETFRALVDATSRPGTVEQTPTTPAVHAVVATLVDHEVTLHGGGDELRTTLGRESRLDTAPFEDADVVVVDGHTDGRVTVAKRGSLKEPSEGATLVYEVADLSADTEPIDGDDDQTLTLAVSGPGVPDTRTFGVDGLPATEVEAIAEAQSGYPRGVDVYLAADDRVVGLPRSVDLSVASDVPDEEVA